MLEAEIVEKNKLIVQENLVIQDQNDEIEFKNQQSDAKTETLRQLVTEKKLQYLVSNRSLTSSILQTSNNIQQLSNLLDNLTARSEDENLKLTEMKKALAKKILQIRQIKNQIFDLTSQTKTFRSQICKDIEYRQDVFNKIKMIMKLFKQNYDIHTKSLSTVNAKVRFNL